MAINGFSCACLIFCVKHVVSLIQRMTAMITEAFVIEEIIMIVTAMIVSAMIVERNDKKVCFHYESHLEKN